MEACRVRCDCGTEFDVPYATVALPELMRAQHPVAASFRELSALPLEQRIPWLQAFLGRPVPEGRSLEGMHADLLRHHLQPLATGGHYGCATCGLTGTAPLSPVYGTLPEGRPIALCPFCGATLRTALAQQCLQCKADWHARGPIVG